MTFRTTVPFIAVVLVGAACSAGSDSAAPVTSPATTATTSTTAVPAGSLAPSDEPLPFESEPIDAGPFFGSASAADLDAAGAAPASQSEPCVDCVPPADDIVPFVPAAVDEPFCTLLAEMNERPFPSDEAEAFVVVQSWITELRALAADPIVGDLDVLLAFLDAAIGSQGQISLDDAAEAVDGAAERIDVYVDTRCLGFGAVTAVVVGPDDPPATASTSEAMLGIDIPVVAFNEDVSDDPTPYFGEDLATGSGGSANPTATQFCLAIHVINNRPQPTNDDTAEIRVGQVYFRAIAPVIPSELADEFDVIDAWIDGVLAVGSFEDVEEPEPGDDISNAVEAVIEYVDDQCLTA